MLRFLLLFFVFSLCWGQRIARIGSEWVFDDFVPFVATAPPPYVVSSFTVKITKDTVINNTSCKIAEISTENATEYRYISENAGKVFVYSPTYNSFKLVYDFSANVGDTLTVYLPESEKFPALPDEVQVIIDSISYLNIGGKSYYAYHQTCLNPTECASFTAVSGWVADTLGGIIRDQAPTFFPRPTYLFPGNISQQDPPNYYLLRCYKYNAQTYVNFYDSLYPGKNFSCYDKIIVYSQDSAEIYTSLQTAPVSIEVYPTLLSNSRRIVVETRNSFEKIKIYDLSGREQPVKVLRKNFGYEVLLPPLSQGIYFLKLQNKFRTRIFKIVIS